MPRTCTVCRDQLRPMIDSALALNESYADLARRTGFSEDALSRHANRHLPKLSGASLEQQLDTWIARIDLLYRSAAASGDLRIQFECAKSAMTILAQKQAIAEQQAEQEVSIPVWTDDGELNPDARQRDMTIADFDQVIKRAIDETYDLSQTCPTCGRPGMPRSESAKNNELRGVENPSQ